MGTLKLVQVCQVKLCGFFVLLNLLLPSGQVRLTILRMIFLATLKLITGYRRNLNERRGLGIIAGGVKCMRLARKDGWSRIAWTTIIGGRDLHADIASFCYKGANKTGDTGLLPLSRTQLLRTRLLVLASSPGEKQRVR